jgi:hypothetical protein
MSVIFIFLSLVLIQPDYELLTTVQVSGEQHYTDQFGNVYVIRSGEIKRFDSEYREVAHYSNPYLGKITSIDLSDPLRILIFYKNYNQVVWLDKYLAEIISPVMLDQLGHEQVPVLCSSSQGGFWLYDEITSQVYYLDSNMDPVYESISLRSMLDHTQQPVSMIEKNKQVYLNVPGKGIIVFDRFGNYLKTIPLTECSRFQVTDTDIIYFNNDSLYKYNTELDRSFTIDLPGTIHPIHAELQPGLLFLFTRNAFQVYRILLQK